MKGELTEHSLPLVNLTVNAGTLNRTNFVPATMEIVHTPCFDDDTLQLVTYNCKLRIRGNTAAKFDKKSFAIKLVDDDGNDLDANLFGIREENSWILDAMAIDRIRMRNRVCFDVWNEMSNGTKGVFVELFINGNYNGIYCFTDKIDRKLLGLKKAKVEGQDSITVRGLLYKGVSWGSGAKLLSYTEAPTNTDRWNAFELKYPDDHPSDITWQPLMDLIDFCSEATPIDSFARAYQDHFYIDNLADYFIFTLALNVGDNAYKNTYLSVVDITQGHRFLLTPWDMDMSLGGYWDGGYDPTLADPNRYDYVAPFNRLKEHNIDRFNDLLAIKWAKHYDTLLSPNAIASRLEAYAKQFKDSGAWQREVARWNNNPVPLEDDIADELAYVNTWYAENYASLCQYFGTSIPVSMTSTTPSQSANGIHTLDGRSVAPNAMRRGIYIVNGKKVVVL